MCPPIQDNVKRVNAITSLRSGRLIDHTLKELMDVPIQVSPSLSPPSLPENDYASRDATKGTPPIDLVDPMKTKQEESKKGDDTSWPSTVE